MSTKLSRKYFTSNSSIYFISFRLLLRAFLRFGGHAEVVFGWIEEGFIICCIDKVANFGSLRFDHISTRNKVFAFLLLILCLGVFESDVKGRNSVFKLYYQFRPCFLPEIKKLGFFWKIWIKMCEYYAKLDKWRYISIQPIFLFKFQLEFPQQPPYQPSLIPKLPPHLRHKGEATLSFSLSPFHSAGYF